MFKALIVEIEHIERIGPGRKVFYEILLGLKEKQYP